MSVRERIALLVEAQGASKAKRDIEGVGKATGKLGDTTRTSGKRMSAARSAASSLGSSIKTLGRWLKYGAVAAGAFALVLGKRSIEEWREAGRVNRVTAARIKSTGQAAGLSADQVGDMSTSLSNLVGIDDEEIQNVANRLLTFTALDRDLFEPALQAAIDMGTEFGNSGSAATQLGKALQDPVKGATALRRMGVNLNEQQQEQINQWVEQGEKAKAQRWILRELNREFGGTAKAHTDGLQRMAVSWANVEESIGGVFGPALDFAGNQFADFADRKMIPLIDSIAAEMRGIWDPNSDDDLQQRLDRTGNLLRTRLAPAWRAVRRDIDRANIDDKLLDVISDATPRIAETMGKGGGRAGVAFVKGVARAPAWAQVLTLAFFMGKFGMLGPLGKWAGKKFLLRFAPELATRLLAAQAVEGAIGTVAAGSKSKWNPLGTRGGKIFGRAFVGGVVLGLALYGDDIARELRKHLPGGDNVIPGTGRGPSDLKPPSDGGVGDAIAETLLGDLNPFAKGGTMPRRGFALVGEEGPEVVELPGGAKVTPNNELAGGTIGDRPVHITSILYLSESGKKEIARSTRRLALRDVLAETAD